MAEVAEEIFCLNCKMNCQVMVRIKKLFESLYWLIISPE